jgi:hypothetical protein
MKIQFDKSKLIQQPDGLFLGLHLKGIKSRLRAEQATEKFKGKLCDAELKIHREQRSAEANAYLWKLLQEISGVVGNITKEDAYISAVQDAGKFDFVLIKNEAVETFIHNWNVRGLGWIAEKTDVHNGNYQQIICYYGSSVYNTKEMSMLLKYVVNEAKDLDIDVRTPDEIAKMEALWEEK